MTRGVLLLLAVFAIPASAQLSYRAEAAWRALVLPRIMRQEAVRAVDPEARHYVAALGQRLAAATPARAIFPYRFILFDDTLGLEVPPFGVLKQTSQANALPGAIVLVPVSLFEAAADEAEFAAAIARGIAHVALRHFARTAAHERLVKPIPPADPRLQPGPLDRLPKSLIFTRSLEREADCGAMAILARAGFNPDALLRLAKNQRASFDTSVRRVRPIEEALSTMPPRAYCPGDNPQFDELKSRAGTDRAAV